MSPLQRTSIVLAAVAAMGPTAASAVAADGTHRLGGAPRMVLIDRHHATVSFATSRLPTRSDGSYRATLRFSRDVGARVVRIRATGRHGSDVVYSARVAARSVLKAGTKYRVSFTLASSKPQRVLVKAYAR